MRQNMERFIELLPMALQRDLREDALIFADKNVTICESIPMQITNRCRELSARTDSRSAESSTQETEATGSRLIILRKNERQE